MKAAISPRSTGVAILNRLIGPDIASMSREAAEEIRRWAYAPEDRARVEILSAKASEGMLTAIERAELEEYIRVDDFLVVLRAKAGASLAARGGAADGSSI